MAHPFIGGDFFVRDFATALQRGPAAFDATSDFVHVDTGRVRLW
jgi:uncharacterized protein YcbK (DUF882 family)